jgi:hypothetical protein
MVAAAGSRPFLHLQAQQALSLSATTPSRGTVLITVGGFPSNLQHPRRHGLNAYNNIVWGNTAPLGHGGDVYFNKGSSVAYAYNNNFTTPAGDSWDQPIDNFTLDPLFVDPAAGDYHLQTGSPCINVGTDTAPGLPATDFEGDDRVIDGDNDSTATVDIGADEYSGTIPTDFNADGVPDILWRKNTGANAIWYMQSNGTSIKSTGSVPTCGTAWDIGG